MAGLTAVDFNNGIVNVQAAIATSVAYRRNRIALDLPKLFKEIQKSAAAWSRLRKALEEYLSFA
jgi:hypothetical protein